MVFGTNGITPTSGVKLDNLTNANNDQEVDVAFVDRQMKGRKTAASLAYAFSERGYVDLSGNSIHTDAASYGGDVSS